MNVEKMRSVLAETYSGPVWRKKLLLMPDRQVIAIYKNMERQGRLTKKAKRPKKQEPGIRKAEQLTIFDFMEDQDGFNTK